MPGRLISFIRAPSSSTPAQHNTHNSPSSPSSPPPSLLPPVYSYDNSHPNKRNRSQESLVMHAFKRHSFGGGHHSNKKSPKAEPQKGATIDMAMESPPIVFYNNPQVSTGALFSGQLRVNVTEPSITLKDFTMQLLAVVSAKKPVVPHCPDCSVQTTEIHKWDFLSAPTSLHHGTHEYPFSHLLPGYLPATTHASLATLDYQLQAVATTEKGDKITFKRELDVKRAIIPAGDKNSVRIFPPTNLTARLTLPGVAHPIGDIPIEMRLSGILTKRGDSQVRWRLRRLTWKIEEVHKFVSPACAKHVNKVGGEGKGVLHEDPAREIGSGEVKDGWKTDLTEGNIELEFRVAPNVALHPACDMESPNGMEVRHNLIVELVVAEEWAPLKKLNQATPTGAARVLRTQFNLVLTERAGMGISWDEEQPPRYDDVPASPPSYATALTTVQDYEGPPLDSETSSLDLSD